MVGELEGVVEADAAGVQAALGPAGGVVQRGHQHADVVEAGELFVGVEADDGAQRQAVAVDVAFAALRAGALASAAEIFATKPTMAGDWALGASHGSTR